MKCVGFGFGFFKSLIKNNNKLMKKPQASAWNQSAPTDHQ